MKVDASAEIWRSYLADYQVSNHGRVRHSVTLRLRKLTISANGYAVWSMWLNGSQRPYAVHRAVLECFVGPCPRDHVGRHLNGDKLDNHLENLAWGTQKENVADTVAQGRHARGEKAGQAKLTEDMVRMIRASDEPGVVLAKRYGVTNTNISYIRKRKSWVHVD